MSKKLRPYLEYQADRIEAVLAAHRAPARVTGGTAGPRHIRFYLSPAPHIRFATIRNLADDLALAMRVPSLTIDRGREGISLTFPNPDPRPARLLDLLPEDAEDTTAVLGLTDTGAPLLARLASPDVAHILVAGTTGSGKTVQLRAIALSLILTHDPATLKLLCIDPKARAFSSLARCPHLLRPPISNMNEAEKALRTLTRLMESRDRAHESPRTGEAHIIILIDELADLVMASGSSAIEGLITRLLQRGREAGIHLIAATQHPSAAILSGLMRANFPLRLAGRAASVDDARVAAGRGGTAAHELTGQGDFLAISGGATYRYQVAYIEEQEIIEELTARHLTTPATDLLDLTPASDSEPGTGLATQPDPIEEDARNLLAWIHHRRAQGDLGPAEWPSITACARWLYDGQTGGQAFYSAKAALARARELEKTTTTTSDTPEILFWPVGGGAHRVVVVAPEEN